MVKYKNPRYFSLTHTPKNVCVGPPKIFWNNFKKFKFFYFLTRNLKKYFLSLKFFIKNRYNKFIFYEFL